MARWATVLLVASLVGVRPAPQVGGSVLTSSDIFSGHLIRRPVAVEGRDWLGVTVSDQGSRVHTVAASWSGTEEFGDSVFNPRVEPGSPGTLLLLVADVPGVVPGPASTATRYEAYLTSAERRMEIGIGARTYALELDGTDPMMCDATVTLSDGSTEQRLYAPDSVPFACDEPHFSVQWSGDLDGDGRLDLVTTFSPKYSVYPRRLYLSSAAAAGELVGLVAVLDATAA